jgi:hypothetical protein
MKIAGNETLDLVVLEFPGMERKIIRRYHESSSFLEICEDYALCMKSVRRLESKKYPGFEEELLPLTEALSDLKEELLSNLDP